MVEFKNASLQDEEMAARFLTVPAYCLEEVLAFVEISSSGRQPPIRNRDLSNKAESSRSHCSH